MTTKLIDSHCHLLLGHIWGLRYTDQSRNNLYLAREVRKIWASAAQVEPVGLEDWVSIGDWKFVMERYAQSPVAFFNGYTSCRFDAQVTALLLLCYRELSAGRMTLGLGLHPWYCYRGILDKELPELIALYDRLKLRAPHLLGPCWGEIGLDRKRKGLLPLAEQQAIMRDFIAATKSRCPNYSWHCVKAHSDLLATLKTFDSDPGPSIGGVVHGFHGSVVAARQLAERGLKLGIGPAVLRPEQEENWRRLLRDPALADSWLLETDHDQQRYDDALLSKIAVRVDSLRGAR